MATIVAITIGMAFRFVISNGLTPAIPANNTHIPDTGDISLPKPPVRKAKLPKLNLLIPNSAAIGVMEVLKAIVAASPDRCV